MYVLMYAINNLCLIEQFYYLIKCYLLLLLGVSTNLCSETLDVRKGQWMTSNKKLIDQSITKMINQLFDEITDRSINQSINQLINQSVNQ